MRGSACPYSTTDRMDRVALMEEGPMISPVSASSAAFWVAQAAGGLRSPLEPHPVSSVHAGVDPLSLLTEDDWNKISRALGRRVGPDAEGNPPSVTPVIAYMIAAMRQDGALVAGSPVTAAALKAR